MLVYTLVAINGLYNNNNNNGAFVQRHISRSVGSAQRLCINSSHIPNDKLSLHYHITEYASIYPTYLMIKPTGCLQLCQGRTLNF